MPEDLQPSTEPHVALWRRYIILGGVALVAIGASIAVSLRRPTNSISTNTSTATIVSGQNTITGRPTFERFQAAPTTNTTLPTVTQPTLEQTQQAIKELQQE
jgi:hypothetical protein